MKRTVVLAGMILALVAGSARATTGDYKGNYRFLFSGVVSGSDIYGVFGAPGVDFSNTPFSESISLDFSKATASADSDYVDWHSSSALFMVSSITIAGKTYSFSQSGFQSAVLDNGNMSHASADGSSRYIFLGDSQAATFGGLTGTAYTAQYLLGTPDDFGQRFTASSASGAFAFASNSCDPKEVLRFSDVVASAPEAGTWALMLAGVAMVGFTIRRRRFAGLAVAAAAAI